MASLTMSTSSLSSIYMSTGELPRAGSNRSLLVAKASNGATGTEQVKLSYKVAEKDNSSRRDLMFAAAAAAACSVAGVAFADEPKAGSAEAKKVYAPICVSMPTARICRN